MKRILPTRTVPAKPFDGAQTIAELAFRLKPFFLSSSLAQPPGASPQATGNRTITVTNRTETTAPRPQDSASIALVAGTLTWTFSTKFTVSPIVTLTPVGTPPSGASLYIDSIAPNAVVVKSTVSTDTRTVNLSAVGNPD